MSKSAPSANNYIALTDTPEIINKKIKKAITDSESLIKYDPVKKPAVANLLTIYSLLADKSIKDLEKQYQNSNYGTFKNDLAEVIIEHLRPIREKMTKLEKDPDYIQKILDKSTKQVQIIADEKMQKIKKKIGLL